MEYDFGAGFWIAIGYLLSLIDPFLQRLLGVLLSLSGF